MNLEKALTLCLGEGDRPVVTAYDLGLILLNFYQKKKFKGESISVQKDCPGLPEFRRYRDRLVDAGILMPLKDFPEDKVFSVFGKSDVSLEEIVCAVDPFSYISHLSAMDYHGISDRMPKILFISTLPQPLWGQKAKEKMQKDFGETLDEGGTGLPRLTRIQFEKVKGVSINRYQSKKIGSFISIKDKGLRVSSLGRTFLDMVRDPKLCGGIRHVLDVYRDNAKNFKKLILDEIDRHGNLIEKARAGYILEEVCGISDPVIDRWVETVERGGSRKLDPNEPYSANFSERWCISINC